MSLEEIKALAEVFGISGLLAMFLAYALITLIRSRSKSDDASSDVVEKVGDLVEVASRMQESAVSGLTKTLDRVLDELGDAKEQTRELKKMVDDQGRKIADLDCELAASNADREKLEEKTDEQAREIAELREEARKKDEIIKELRNQISKLTESDQKKDAKILELQTQLKKVERERDSLLERVRKLEKDSDDNPEGDKKT
jgi:chromosome segregation ATPase